MESTRTSPARSSFSPPASGTGGRARLGRIAALLATLLLPACSLLERQPIPLPFGPRPDYGRVVRRIDLEGNDVTDSSLIRNTLVTKVGDVYDVEDATRDYNRLQQLGVFTLILFETEPFEDGITLTVHLAETSPYIPALSFALTEENGVELGPSFTSPNLFGRASKTSAFMRFGGARNTGISFRDSWHPSAAWYACCWTFEYFHRERDNPLDHFQENADEATLQFLVNVTDRFHLGPKLAYLGIGADVDSLGVRPDVTLDGDGRDEVPGAGVVVEFDSRNVANYPTQGWYVAVSGLQYGGFLGGPANYPRLDVDLRRYHEITGPRHSLAAYSLLTLTGGEMGVDVPIHQDYHLGGTNSVRGWPLGSREGKNQWINTVEYWWNLLPRSAFRFWFVRWSMGLQLAAFTDVATAWDNGDEFRANWIGGGGVGARLTIPQVGLLRFDMAVGKPHPRMTLLFHIAGGERAESQKKRVR